MSGKFLARASALSLAVLLAACGGDDDSAPIVNVGSGSGDPSTSEEPTGTDDNSNGDDSGTDQPGEDTGEDTPDVVALLGTGKGSAFNEGQLFIVQPSIEAGGSHQFSITLADPETKEPWLRSGQSVEYTSPCMDAGLASIEAPSAPESGEIKGTYTSSGCYGEDLIHAFVGTSNNPAASGKVTIEQPVAVELALADYDPQTASLTAVNTIKAISTDLQKYGQTRLTVGIVDINDGNELQNGIPFTVNFESVCADGLNTSAFAPASVTTTTGIAETIFTAGECTSNPQQVTATIQDQDGVSQASININVDTTQAFQMVAGLPEPMSIAPSFLSTEGRETASTVRFTLEDQSGGDGDPMKFEEVTFTIDSPDTAEFVEQGTGTATNTITVTTNADGVAAARVRAKEGIDHEEFRVIATYGDLTTYSMPIVVNSLLPFQPKFSLSAENFAPDTWGVNGVQSGLTLYVADKNGNRVRGNTYVNFQTDQGSINPDCVVTDGRCNVTWESLATSAPYAIITASTHGRISDTEIGTISSTTTLLMSTNNNVFLELTRNGDQEITGTEYCATAWVELPGEGATKFSPPVGTTITFAVDTGEAVQGAVTSKTIGSTGDLVLDSDGYEVCTSIKPEVDDTVTPNTNTIELTATAQTPGDGASETEILFETW